MDHQRVLPRFRGHNYADVTCQLSSGHSSLNLVCVPCRPSVELDKSGSAVHQNIRVQCLKPHCDTSLFPSSVEKDIHAEPPW